MNAPPKVDERFGYNVVGGGYTSPIYRNIVDRDSGISLQMIPNLAAGNHPSRL